MFRVNSLLGALGVMLFLIALYLVLRNSTGAARIFTAGGGTLTDIFRTLQGR